MLARMKQNVSACAEDAPVDYYQPFLATNFLKTHRCQFLVVISCTYVQTTNLAIFRHNSSNSPSAEIYSRFSPIRSSVTSASPLAGLTRLYQQVFTLLLQKIRRFFTVDICSLALKKRLIRGRNCPYIERTVLFFQ